MKKEFWKNALVERARLDKDFAGQEKGKKQKEIGGEDQSC